MLSLADAMSVNTILRKACFNVSFFSEHPPPLDMRIKTFSFKKIETFVLRLL